jgi:hypothetical protein
VLCFCLCCCCCTRPLLAHAHRCHPQQPRLASCLRQHHLRQQLQGSLRLCLWRRLQNPVQRQGQVGRTNRLLPRCVQLYGCCLSIETSLFTTRQPAYPSFMQYTAARPLLRSLIVPEVEIASQSLLACCLQRPAQGPPPTSPRRTAGAGAPAAPTATWWASAALPGARPPPRATT